MATKHLEFRKNKDSGTHLSGTSQERYRCLIGFFGVFDYQIPHEQPLAFQSSTPRPEQLIDVSSFRPSSSPASTPNKASSSRRFAHHPHQQAPRTKRRRLVVSPISPSISRSSFIDKHSGEQICRLPHTQRSKINRVVYHFEWSHQLRSAWHFANGYNETICD